jgi:hypothetical protein
VPQGVHLTRALSQFKWISGENGLRLLIRRTPHRFRAHMATLKGNVVAECFRGRGDGDIMQFAESEVQVSC